VSNSEPCELLPWDTEFFGLTIARVTWPTISREKVGEIDQWCRTHRVQCLYLNLDASSGAFPPTDVVEEAGFRLVDVKLTMERGPLTPEELAVQLRGCPVRPATHADLAELEPMAAMNHRGGRFSYDHGFPRGKSEELFRAWIRTSVNHTVAGTPDPQYGHRHLCLVAEMDVIRGYSACRVKGDGSGGRISLLGVDDRARGVGHGRNLVFASLDYFTSQGLAEIDVITQAHNIPAQRLYQRCGFVTSGCTFVFHQWYPHG
jgi:dTDP-4-amino-4,6-dideoxy-D-galactose acyltransferase